MYLCVYVNLDVCTYICMYECIYVCTYVCMYVWNKVSGQMLPETEWFLDAASFFCRNINLVFCTFPESKMAKCQLSRQKIIPNMCLSGHWSSCQKDDSILTVFKLKSGWPDWANFRLLGGGLLCAAFWKLQKYPKLLGYLLQITIYAIILTKNGLGHILGTLIEI
jgi:hypothetical protein